MNLENRFFYRLVKVWRILWITIAVIIVPVVVFCNIPDKVSDNNNSYVICTDNTNIKTSFNSLGIKTHSDDDNKLSESDDDKAENFCSKNSKFILQDALYPTIKIVYEPRNWSGYSSIVLITFTSFLVFYALLNLFCEVLLYLAFEKKLSWRWITFFMKG